MAGSVPKGHTRVASGRWYRIRCERARRRNLAQIAEREGPDETDRQRDEPKK